jgi:hypothetical protein
VSWIFLVSTSILAPTWWWLERWLVMTLHEEPEMFWLWLDSRPGLECGFLFFLL